MVPMVRRTRRGLKSRAAVPEVPSLAKRLTAEAVGTALLLATVVGSGVMAEELAGGNVAIALLGNSIPTGAILVVLILMLGPISGAHFNPAVTIGRTLTDTFSGIQPAHAPAFIAAQLVGSLVAVFLARWLFASVRAGE
jgi:glycerol uptake facilitator-like aquaporin